MTPAHALIWFVATTLGVFGMIVVGIYCAMRGSGNPEVDDRIEPHG